MQIQISNEAAAIQAAKAAGLSSVEEYVNLMIQQASDLEAVREGLADIDAGRVTPLADFDRAFRAEMGFTQRDDS